MYHTELLIGEVIYKFFTYNIPSSWTLSLNGFEFIDLLCDSEYDLYQGVFVSFFLSGPPQTFVNHF